MQLPAMAWLLRHADQASATQVQTQPETTVERVATSVKVCSAATAQLHVLPAAVADELHGQLLTSVGSSAC